MKDNFSYNVSHELKTPMISVIGYVGMLLKEKVGSLAEGKLGKGSTFTMMLPRCPIK
jgi:signal transduction histidine kinase